MRESGQQQVLFSKASENLANATQFDHFTKHQLNGLLHTLVGIFFQFSTWCPTEPDWNRNLQFAAANCKFRFQSGSVGHQVENWKKIPTSVCSKPLSWCFVK